MTIEFGNNSRQASANRRTLGDDIDEKARALRERVLSTISSDQPAIPGECKAAIIYLCGDGSSVYG